MGCNTSLGITLALRLYATYKTTLEPDLSGLDYRIALGNRRLNGEAQPGPTFILALCRHASKRGLLIAFGLAPRLCSDGQNPYGAAQVMES